MTAIAEIQTPHDLASPGKRVAARLIDIVLVVAAGVVVVSVINPGSFVRSLTYVVIGALYEIAMITMRGQTVGKMIMNIEVVGVETAVTPSALAATIRWATHGVWGLVPFGLWITLVTFISPGFRDRMMGFHDSFANTVVIHAA